MFFLSIFDTADGPRQLNTRFSHKNHQISNFNPFFSRSFPSSASSWHIFTWAVHFVPPENEDNTASNTEFHELQMTTRRMFHKKANTRGIRYCTWRRVAELDFRTRVAPPLRHATPSRILFFILKMFRISRSMWNSNRVAHISLRPDRPLQKGNSFHDFWCCWHDVLACKTNEMRWEKICKRKSAD